MAAWGDVPAWVTAGVAFLALIGAMLAYRTQSEQLRLQRIQFEDQTRVQEREQANQVDVTTGVLDGAQARVLPTNKGEPVHMVVVTNGSKRPIRDVTCRANVYSAASELFGPRRADGQPVRQDELVKERRAPDVLGQVTAIDPGGEAQTFVLRSPGIMWPVLKAGDHVAFVWGLATAQWPRLVPLVRFTDDAGLHWEIDRDLHLQKLNSRDW
jgi:hypothetical protein